MSSTKGAPLSWCTAVIALALAAWPSRAPAKDVNEEHFRLPLVFHCSPSVAIGFGPLLVLDVVVRDTSRLDAISGATYDLETPRTEVAVGLTSFIGGPF